MLGENPQLLGWFVTAKLVAILASAGLASSGVYAASATRAADVLPAASVALMAQGSATGEKCVVNVDRNGTAGVANVTRSVLASGQCVCNVSTGPEAGNGSAEGVVSALLRDRTCDGAPAAGDAGAEQAGGGGGSGGVLGGVVGAVAVGGLAAGLGGKSKG